MSRKYFNTIYLEQHTYLELSPLVVDLAHGYTLLMVDSVGISYLQMYHLNWGLHIGARSLILLYHYNRQATQLQYLFKNSLLSLKCMDHLGIAIAPQMHKKPKWPIEIIVLHLKDVTMVIEFRHRKFANLNWSAPLTNTDYKLEGI